MTYFDAAQRHFPIGLYSYSPTNTVKSLVPAPAPVVTRITKFGQPLVAGSEGSFVLTEADLVTFKNEILGLGREGDTAALAFCFRPLHRENTDIVGILKNHTINIYYVDGRINVLISKESGDIEMSYHVGPVHRAYFVVVNFHVNAIEMFVNGTMAASYEMTEEEALAGYTDEAAFLMATGPQMLDGVTVFPYALRGDQAYSLTAAATNWLDYVDFAMEEGADLYDFGDQSRMTLWRKKWPDHGWDSEGTVVDGVSGGVGPLIPVADEDGVNQAGSWTYAFGGMDDQTESPRYFSVNWDRDGDGAHLYVSLNGGAEQEVTTTKTAFTSTEEFQIRIAFDAGSTAQVNSLEVALFDSLTVAPATSGPTATLHVSTITPEEPGSPMEADNFYAASSTSKTIIPMDNASTVADPEADEAPVDESAQNKTQAVMLSLAPRAYPANGGTLAKIGTSTLSMSAVGGLSVSEGSLFVNGANYDSKPVQLNEWVTAVWNLATPNSGDLSVFDGVDVAAGPVYRFRTPQVAGNFKRLSKSATNILTQGSNNSLTISDGAEPAIYQKEWAIVSGG